jgi:hypothetical protein
MDYYEVKYRDTKFDITFDLKFNLDELFVYLENHEEDIHLIISAEIKERIEDYLTENYSHYYEEMENDHHKQMMHLIRNNKI